MRIFLLFLLIMNHQLFSDKVKAIMKPVATHKADRFIELKLTRTIGPELGTDNFLIRAYDIKVIKNGSFVVWDNYQNRFLLFNQNYKLLKRFGRNGQGPGELSNSRMNKDIFICQNHKINITDYFSRKLISFNTYGKLVEEIKYPGNNTKILYLFKGGTGAILNIDKNLNSCLELFDLKKGRTIKPLLPSSEFREFLYYAPAFEKETGFPASFNHWGSPSMTNTRFEHINENSFIVHQSCSSVIYIFENYKLKTKFPVRPLKGLSTLKIKVARMKKKIGSSNFFIQAMPGFFIDYKDRKHFYICTYLDEKDYSYIYKLDLKGKLLKAFKVKKGGRILAGTDGKFFSAGYDNIKILEVK